MKHATFATLIAASAAGAALLLGAGTAHAASSAETTIDLLEAQGFTVRVDRVGSAPLDECTVIDVRNPRETTNFIDNDDDDFNPFEEVRRTITVSLDCSR